MPAGDVYECAYDLTYAGQNITTVFHFAQVSSDGAGDARDSCALMFFNQMVTPYLLALNDGLVSQGTRIRRIFPTETQALTSTFNDAGSVVQAGLPPNQVGILRTYGPLTGRRGIGRIMIPAIIEEDVQHGRLNIDQLTFRNVLAAALEIDQVDGTTAYIWHAAVFSRLDNIARQINSAGMLTQIKNLRSRTRSA